MVASGRTSSLRIFGNDYPTTDGTGIRDYIHVMDLAEGHVSALRALEASDAGTLLTANLGTGHGISVLEMVKSFERVNAVDLHCEILGRRPGDVAISFADCSLARAKLHWAAKRSLEDMCRDAWNWTVKNPNGF
jgi:UDP-glucose 4-epimerase